MPGWRRLATATAALLVLTGAALFTGGAPAVAAVPDRVGFVLWNGVVVASGTSPAGTSVVPLGVGRYQVKFVGQGIAGGVVHVTAINASPHWCQVESFAPSGPDEIVVIRCYRPGGALDNSAFTAIFFEASGPGAFGPYGYVDAKPLGSFFTQYNSVGAVNTVTRLTTGLYNVKFPGLATSGPRDGSLQATAVNAVTGAHCVIVGWASNTSGQNVGVNCFDSFGASLDTQFELTFQYKQSLYGSIAPPKYFGYIWWAPGAGPATTNYNSQVGANVPSPAGTGLVTIKFPQLAQLPDTVQVTATGSAPNFCSLNSIWAHVTPDTVVRDVFCFTVNGTPVNNGFTASDNSRV
jgi:hypothetical protein